MDRLRIAVKLGAYTAGWCWVLTAIHGIYSIGIVLGFLNGGVVPLYPTWPVTYWSFLLDANGALFLTFTLVLIACTFLPPRVHLTTLWIIWPIGFFFGSDGITYLYQTDLGTTWHPVDAFFTLFFHPIFTSLTVIAGLAGTALLTRHIRFALRDGNI